MSPDSSSTQTDEPKPSESSQRLRAATAEFDRGDFHASRRSLEILLRAAPSPATRQQAELLKARLGTDRVSIGLAVACAILFAVVALSYLT